MIYFPFPILLFLELNERCERPLGTLGQTWKKLNSLKLKVSYSPPYLYYISCDVALYKLRHYLSSKPTIELFAIQKLENGHQTSTYRSDTGMCEGYCCVFFFVDYVLSQTCLQCHRAPNYPVGCA